MCSGPQLTSDPLVLMDGYNLLLFHKMFVFDKLNPVEFDGVALGNTFKPIVINPERVKSLGRNGIYFVPQNISW